MIDSCDEATQPLPVTGPMRLHFASDARVYAAELIRDLLGDWVVTQAWGGKFSHRGGGRTVLVADEEAGFRLLQKIVKRREKRGYRLL